MRRGSRCSDGLLPGCSVQLAVLLLSLPRLASAFASAGAICRMQRRSAPLAATAAADERASLVRSLRSSPREAVLHSIDALGAARTPQEATLILSALGRVGEWQQALRLLADLEKHEADDALKPNAITYNAAVTACAKSQQWAHARRLLQLMRRRGMRPTELSLAIVIGASSASGAWRDGLRALAELRTRGSRAKPRSYEGAMRRAALEQLVAALGDAGQWEEALRVLETMRAADGVAPTERAYLDVLSALADAGEWEIALEVPSLKASP